MLHYLAGGFFPFVATKLTQSPWFLGAASRQGPSIVRKVPDLREELANERIREVDEERERREPHRQADILALAAGRLEEYVYGSRESATLDPVDARGQSPTVNGTPALIWLLTLVFAVKAFVAVVGSFIFAFPRAWPLGPIVGLLLIVAGVAYAIIAMRMRLGERVIWLAALVVPVVHQSGLAVLDLTLYGAIPSTDYLFIGITVVVVILILLPVTRRFFSR